LHSSYSWFSSSNDTAGGAAVGPEISAMTTARVALNSMAAGRALSKIVTWNSHQNISI